MEYRIDIDCERGGFDEERKRSHWAKYSFIYGIIIGCLFVTLFASLIGYWAWKIVMVGFYASFSTSHATAYALYMNETVVLSTTMPP